MKIVVDMMGGDLTSKVIVDAIDAFSKEHEYDIFYCVGAEDELSSLKSHKNVIIVPSTSVLKMDVDPMEAMHSRTSSMFIAFDTYKKENCDCLITCGSTAACVTLGTFKLKRVEGVTRPALLTPFPSIKPGKAFVALDLGANVSNTAEDLKVYARLGSIYYKVAYGKENPEVYLLNNGTEEEKGDALHQEAYQLLKNDETINFLGNIEARYPIYGDLDVLVTDGYTGNIFLKAVEGSCKAMSELIKKAFKKNLSTKIGYLFAKSGVKDIRSIMDYKNVGGAMLIGVNGVVIKAHGNSDARSFTSALKIGYKVAKTGILEKIKEEMNK